MDFLIVGPMARSPATRPSVISSSSRAPCYPIPDRPKSAVAGKHGNPVPAPGQVAGPAPVRQAGAASQRCSNSGKEVRKKGVSLLLQAPLGQGRFLTNS
jgi:hypothetical protein